MKFISKQKEAQKLLVSGLLSLVLTTTTLTPAFAISATPSGALKRFTTIETALKTRADREIDRRIAALTLLTTRIGEIKKLNATELASLKTQIQAEITSLNNLKAKIDADTDGATLRADVASIVKEYRVYALFIPKIHLLAAADVITQTADLLTTVADNLSNQIDRVGSAGKDVNSLKLLLTDMKAKIAAAKNGYQSITSTVTPLTPDGYPNNKTTMQAARGLIKTGAADLRAARDDAHQIVLGLKSLTGGNASGSATLRSTPSATPKP